MLTRCSYDLDRPGDVELDHRGFQCSTCTHAADSDQVVTTSVSDPFQGIILGAETVRTTSRAVLIFRNKSRREFVHSGD